MYAVHIKGFIKDYGYNSEELDKLGTEGDARKKIYYDVLDKAVSDTKIRF